MDLYRLQNFNTHAPSPEFLYMCTASRNVSSPLLNRFQLRFLHSQCKRLVWGCCTILWPVCEAAAQYCGQCVRLLHNTVASVWGCCTILWPVCEVAAQYCGQCVRLLHNTVASVYPALQSYANSIRYEWPQSSHFTALICNLEEGRLAPSVGWDGMDCILNAVGRIWPWPFQVRHSSWLLLQLQQTACHSVQYSNVGCELRHAAGRCAPHCSRRCFMGIQLMESYKYPIRTSQ